MHESSPPTDRAGGRWRRSRRYSPFDRSAGLRRVPDDAIVFSAVGSLLFHVALAAWLVQATHAPAWAPGATMAFLDLTEPRTVEPDGPVSTSGKTTPSAPPAVPAARSTSVPAQGAAPRSTIASSVPVTPRAEEPAREAAAESMVQQGTRASQLSVVPDAVIEPAQPGPAPAPTSTAAAPPTESQPPTAAAPARGLTPVPTMPSLAAATVAPDRVEPRLAEIEPLAALIPSDPARPAPVVAAAGPAPRVARRTPAAPKSPAAAPLGLGLGPARIQLDGPRERTSDRSAEVISGRLTGSPAARIAVYVNGEPIAVEPGPSSFELSVPLKAGLNSVRAVAFGPTGTESEDIIKIEYALPARVALDAIRLASPVDAVTLGSDDPPVVSIEGDVTDRSVDSAWIVANDRRTAVAVRDGHFRHVLVVYDPLVQVWAETSERQRSQTVTVRRTPAVASTGILVVQRVREGSALDLEVSATWRAQPDRLDSPVQTVTLPAVASASDGTPNDVFYLRGLKPGVYTLAVRSRGAAPADDIRSTFYLSDRTGLKARPLGSTRLDGGRAVLAKVLLPYGILWSQDEWFSGLSESVDTVTKFRVPEGISWVERKADVR